MEGARLDTGQTWAYRERVSYEGSALLRAEILQRGPKGSNKVRVCIAGGEYPGLEQWVPRRRLIVPWDEADAWLEDERRLAVLAAFSDDADETVSDAVQVIFDSYHPGQISLGWNVGERGLLRIDNLPNVARDLGLSEADLLAEPSAFVDRLGVYRAPWAVALRLAQIVVIRYRDQVLAAVAEQERELRQKAVTGSYTFSPRSKHFQELEIEPETYVSRLAEDLPVFTLIRQWCGTGEQDRWDENQALRAEIDRLRKLVEGAINTLRSHGHPHLAKRLEMDYWGEQYELRAQAREKQRASWRLPPNE